MGKARRLFVGSLKVKELRDLIVHTSQRAYCASQRAGRMCP